MKKKIKLLLAPHNDDEVLFAAYTIMREKPLVIVITDGWQHVHRYNISVEQRRRESVEAMNMLCAPILFMGLPDDNFIEDELRERLKWIDADVIYAPEVYQNGNPQHNMVGRVAKELFGDKVKTYSTYEIHNLEPKGNIIIMPTEEEKNLKEHALSKYISQLGINRAHFDAVRGKPEYLC